MTIESVEEGRKSLAEAKANVSKAEAEAKRAEAAANKAWDSRDREAFNAAENERLQANANVSKHQTTVTRLEGAIADFENVAKRESTEPVGATIASAIRSAATSAEVAKLISESDGLSGYTFTVGFRNDAGELNDTGPTVGVKPQGAWFRTASRGGGGARTAGSHYTFTHDGQEYSEAGLVEAFADKVWDGDKLERVRQNAKGENRIRNALRIAKELGIVPTPIS